VLFPVEDPDDPRLLAYVGLRDHQLRMRREKSGGDMAALFVAEGDRVVDRAIRAGYVLKSALIDGRRTTPLPDLIPDDVPVYAVAPPVLQKITGYHLHRGMLACFHRRDVPPPSVVLANARRIVVIEGVNNPTNLGVVARSAVALGMDAMLLDPTCCDPLYRRAARVSMGEVFAFPYARLDPLPGGLDVIREHGFRLVALTPAPDGVDLHTLAPAPDEKIAILLGAEGPGLSPSVIDASDVRARIPMHGEVDSLNIGVAAAVACYVLGRQQGEP
jgi:tRNA G18 (ribose-2'-O)-methylase SpoU